MSVELTWHVETSEGGCYGWVFIPADIAGVTQVDGRWPLLFENGNVIPAGRYMLVTVDQDREDTSP